MARKKKADSSLTVKEMDLKEAQREFSRRRGRGSKYDSILDAAEKLAKGKALIVGQASYSEVTGIRNRVKDHLGTDWKIEATKVDKEQNLFDVLIHRK